MRDVVSAPVAEVPGLAGLSAQLIRANLKVTCNTIRGSPHVALVPAVVLALLLVGGQVGVFIAAGQFLEQRHELAASVAASAAQQVSLLLQNVVAPTMAVVSAIQSNPRLTGNPGSPGLLTTFPASMRAVQDKLDVTGSVIRVLLTPWGVNAAVYPVNPANLATLGYSYLGDVARRNLSIAAYAQGPGYLDIIGPVALLDVGVGFVARANVWIANAPLNATFGMGAPFAVPLANITLGGAPQQQQLALCGTACAPVTKDNTTYIFWGAVNTVMRAQPIITRLSELEQQVVPYKYVLFRRVDASINNDALRQSSISDARTTGQIIFASTTNDGSPFTGSPTAECTPVPEQGSGIMWALCIQPSEGWQPAWLIPLQVAIAFTALLLAGLVFAMLLSQSQHAQLVARMLPESVVKYLKLGLTYTKPYKQVTICFADIVQYTTLSTQVSPNQLVELLNDLYCHFDDLVDRHGLYKVQTIGDAFMCMAGAPVVCDPKDAAIRVARMALDMVDFVRQYETKDGRQIQIRVGVNTGDVTAAVIGRKTPTWTVVGDAVNVASRMESNSLPMHVHVGMRTAALLAGAPNLELRPRGAISVKGKGVMQTSFVWRKDMLLRGALVHSPSHCPMRHPMRRSTCPAMVPCDMGSCESICEGDAATGGGSLEDTCRGASDPHLCSTHVELVEDDMECGPLSSASLVQILTRSQDSSMQGGSS